ncbi:hypothetical protein MRB53_038331 [Persea americana]|nr:hypothetical protein MRB53_038331 [Persea americana]
MVERTHEFLKGAKKVLDNVVKVEKRLKPLINGASEMIDSLLKRRWTALRTAVLGSYGFKLVNESHERVIALRQILKLSEQVCLARHGGWLLNRDTHNSAYAY